MMRYRSLKLDVPTEELEEDNIETIETIDGSILAAVAVYIGKTRLIDNFIYES